LGECPNQFAHKAGEPRVKRDWKDTIRSGGEGGERSRKIERRLEQVMTGHGANHRRPNGRSKRKKMGARESSVAEPYASKQPLIGKA